MAKAAGDGKHLPRNLDSERLVLGSMILDQEAAGVSLSLLREEHFYSPAHQKIYAAIQELYDSDEQVELSAVAAVLKKRGSLEEVGGPGYLSTIVRSVATTTNIEYHARIVKDKSNRRQLIETCAQIMERGVDEKEDTDALLEETEKLIFEIAQQQVRRGFVHAETIVHQSMESIEQSYQHKSVVTGLDTGYRKLNLLTSGLQKADLIILAARPSAGKTTFGLNLAQNVAARQNKPVGIFSLEMSADPVIRRLLCAEARVAMGDITTGRISRDRFADLADAANRLMHSPIYIDDTPGISITDIRTRARRLATDVPELSLIIVDYIQLITTSGRERREQEVAYISRQLKSLARDLSVPIIAISQLSRAIERRDDATPRLSDLRESGAIEQDADLVMFVHHEQPKAPKGRWGGEKGGEEVGSVTRSEEENRSSLLLRKHRNGPTGDVELYFIKECFRFEDIASAEDDEVPPF